jgi:hypothetical protein
MCPVMNNQNGRSWINITRMWRAKTLLPTLIFLQLVAAAQGACVLPPAGLVGWWRAESNGNDAAGTNNAFSLPNVQYASGVVGQAFAFDPQNYPYGVYTGVRIADQPYYALTNSLSIEAWIRPRGPGYVIFYRGDNRVGIDPYSLGTGLDNILGFTITDANGTSVSVAAPLTYDQWWHVAGTLDGASGKMSLYTNGTLAAQITTAVRPFGPLIPQDSPGIGIGNVNDGFNNFPFRGDIDEVALYDRALSGAEITAIYNAVDSGKCPDKVAPFIVAQPENRTALAGEPVHFSVSALGTAPLSYQWKLNGAGLADETKSSLSFVSVQMTNAGTYSVEVTNSAGAITSSGAVLAVNPRSTCAPRPPGLVGWWRGEGNGSDTANTNDAYSSPNVTFTAGTVGQAFAFDPQNYPYGVYTGIRVADKPYYALTNSLSIEGWIRPRGPGYCVFYRGDNRPGLDPYVMSMGNNETVGFGITDATGASASVSAPLAYNRWWHVAGTLDGASGKLSLYTNGNLAAQITTAIRPFGDLNAARAPGIGIGNVNDGFNNFPFRGDIDEVSLYDRALTAADVAAIFNAGEGGKCQTLNHAPVAQCADVMATAGTNCMADASINNGSFDPDGDPITFSQTPAGPYPLGTNIVTLTVTDNGGAASLGTARVIVTDGTPPVLVCLPDKQVQCGAVWAFDQPVASDACGVASVSVLSTVSNVLCGGTFAATRTWQAADGSSNQVTCSQTVTVVDTTPPSIVCPTSPVVEFQDATGAVASYVVTASDVCSSISLAVTPASGSRFPIGITPATAVAVDACGNSNRCAFHVTVLGAQGVKSNVLAELTALRSGAAAAGMLGQKLEGAICHLAASLNPAYWIDQTHLHFKSGNVAMLEEKLAARALADIMDTRGSPFERAMIQGLAERIAKCDRLLAIISIQEAARAGLTAKKVEQDLAMVDRGDRDAATGRYDNAIEHYRNAWRHALQLQLRVDRNADGSTRLEFVGNTSQAYRVEVSTDMLNWIVLGTCTADSDGNVSFTHANTSAQSPQFYRVVEQ